MEPFLRSLPVPLPPMPVHEEPPTLLAEAEVRRVWLAAHAAVAVAMFIRRVLV